MSIEISFTAKPAVHESIFGAAPARPKSGIDLLLRTLGRLMNPYECSGEICPEDGYFKLHFCPQGYIAFRIRDDVLEGESQTNVAGAGFHAAVIDFLEELARKSDYTLELYDPTGYYETRDFERLRNDSMYVWLANMLNTVLSGEAQGASLAVAWDAEDYIPQTEEGMIFTPMGAYRYPELCNLVRQRDIRGLANEFFIWDDRNKTARYFRNSALALMWHDCRFMPSSRSPQDAQINERVLSLLQKAVRMDSDMPFPKREYLELCRLAERKPVDVSHLSDYPLFQRIGYRRGTVLERVGRFRIPVPGKFLREHDSENDAAVFVFPKEYGRRTVYCFKPFSLAGEQDFADIYSGPDLMEVFRFNTKTTRVKAAVFHNQQDIAGDYNVMSQVICGRDMLLASFTFDDPDEQDTVMEILRNITLEDI